MSKFIKKAVIISLGFTPLITFAAVGDQAPVIGGLGDIQGILDRIINLAFGVLLTVSAFMIIWAAYNYLTAGGNDEKVKTAHNTIIYAAVGIGVAMLAKSFSFIIGQILGR